MNAADSITERLDRLDRIVDALKVNPLASGIRIFGSALTSATPGDIDCLYEGDTRKGLGDLVRLAFADGNYGYLDPFAIGPDGILFVRNAERPTWDMARQSTAAGILRAGRAGTPVLEFDRRLADEWKAQRAAADAIIAEAADWYYDVAGLYEDEDLDPEDHLEVVQRAFSSSDCDDFAAVLAEMTAWTPVRAQWSHPDIGFGHHALVQHPNGGMMDVHGWTNEHDLRTRYGIKGEIAFLPEAISPQTLGDHVDEDGIDPIKQRIANVIRALPHAPFLTDAKIRTLIQRPLPGVDLPDEPSSPAP